MTANELGQAQLMAIQMAQAEAALQHANYMQKVSDMQKMSAVSMSAHSKAEREYQMAMSALMPWPPRPDLMSPFHPLTHQHLLAVQQQQQLQQQLRESELEKEKQKQQQKLREREQQQKREREREREQQKQRQEQLERKHQQQKLQEQQQQFKHKHLQMMQQQQRKLDAAHSQFQRDVAKRSYEAMAVSGLGLPGVAPGELPRKAHSDAKKARTVVPGSYPPTNPPTGKPRPSHTKENGSSGSGGGGGGGGSSGGSRGGGGGSGGSLSSASGLNPLNLPVPIPVSPVAPPRMWSSCFPHSLPAPTMDIARLYGLSEDVAKQMAAGGAAAVTGASRTAHTAPTTTPRRSAHAPSASTSSSSSSSSTAPSAGGGGGSGGGGGEVLDLSVSKR